MGLGVIAGGDQGQSKINPKMLNRHGLITGATGTGKTVTLQVLAEQLADMGIPSFVSDVKGDLSGFQAPGNLSDKVQSRVDTIGLKEYSNRSYELEYWDVFGEGGLPFRTTVSEMGPLLLARLFGLSDVQSGILNIAFRVADDLGMLLIDLKDLRSFLNHLSTNAKEFEADYGRITSTSVSAIVRSLLVFEDQGGDKFFGEPDVEIADLFRTNQDGQGIINVFNASKLMSSPGVYSAFLLWIMSELFENLPEVGDLDKPKMVFFFDEAHLLFNDMPKVLEDKITQMVKLIRSKGVGIFFVTQNPLDIPDDVLGQLGNRIQHALRAYTPKERKSLKAAADSFRQSEGMDLTEIIPLLGLGEALVSLLDEEGKPGIVQRALISPPRSQIGPVPAAEVQRNINQSPLHVKYFNAVDRESAYEILAKKVENEEVENKRQEDKQEAEAPKKAKAKKGRMSVSERVISNVLSSAGRTVGNKIVRGILGSIKF